MFHSRRAGIRLRRLCRPPTWLKFQAESRERRKMALRLEVLVNNAGVHRGGRVQHLSIEDWDLVLRTHLYGSFYCAKEAVPLMRAAGAAG